MKNNLIRIAIVCILLFISSIALASAETVVTVAECSICHSDVAFDAATVNRSLTCVNCHFGYHTKGTLTEFGYFKSNESANVTAPYVHIKHVESKSYTPCTDCHRNIDCDDCHIPEDIFHISHGSNGTTPIYSCESELCHNKIVTHTTRNAVPVDTWNITQSPACENCHDRHNITASHQSDLTPDCQTCHSNYLPDTHAEIAILSYEGDSCSVCHKSTNETVMFAIANDDPRCIACHTLHGDITEIHTSTSMCIDCHQPYLPELHDDYAVEYGVTNCSVCHNNANITIAIASADCTTCHGTQLPPQHVNEVEKHTTPACAICHGTYNESYLPTTHNATVDNGRCDLCHNNPLIDMSISTSNCSTCHGPQIAQAHYNASVKHTFKYPVQCADCHDMYIPRTHSDQYGNVNCFICHKNNPDITYLPTDKNCTSCHGTQIPEPHLDVNHTSTSECTSCHEEDLSAVHLDNCTVCHRNPAIDMERATTDCNSCHVDQDIGFHVHEVEKHTSSSCSLCHDAYLPATHDATVENGRCDLCHANPAIDMSISTSDCTSCHGTQMDPPHYNVSVKHAFESPAECARCHDLNLAATHSDQYGSVMCFACHDNSKIPDLPTDKDCLSCHGPDGPYPSHKSRGENSGNSHKK